MCCARAHFPTPRGAPEHLAVSPRCGSAAAASAAKGCGAAAMAAAKANWAGYWSSAVVRALSGAQCGMGRNSCGLTGGSLPSGCPFESAARMQAESDCTWVEFNHFTDARQRVYAATPQMQARLSSRKTVGPHCRGPLCAGLPLFTLNAIGQSWATLSLAERALSKGQPVSNGRRKEG